MSLIKKLKRITLGRIEAFLDTLEDPAYIIPQLEKELAAKLEIAINAQAKSLTSVKSARRKLDETEGKLLRYEKLIQSAISNNDEQLTRKIIAAQILAEEEKQSQEKFLQSTEKAYIQAQQVCLQLKSNIENLRQKAKELKCRNETAKHLQSSFKKQTDFSGNNSSILDTISRMEEKIIAKESEIEVRQELSSFIEDSEAFDDLEKSAEIDKRLNMLKNNLQNE